MNRDDGHGTNRDDGHGTNRDGPAGTDADAPTNADSVRTDGGTATTNADDSPLSAVDETLRMVSWYPIAKKELLDTTRSWVLWLVSVLFLAVFVIPLAVVLYTGLGPTAKAVGALVAAGARSLASILVPLAAIAVSFAAVSGERQGGSLKLLLSLPYTRRDVVMGKFVSRLTVVGLPLLVALVLRLLVAAPKGNVGALDSQAIFVGLTLVLAAVFVAIGVGLSAATKTTNRSIGAVFGVYVYLFLFWNSLANGIGNLLSRFTDVQQLTKFKVVLFVKLLNPTQAYKSLLSSLLGTPTYVARVQMFGSLLSGRQARLQTQLKQQLLAKQFQNSLPVYLGDPAAAVVLVAWIVVPLVVGYYLFEHADL
ncbi:MAG: ABC transporter permease subunit [Haloarculaceae archaeon]